jgi:hypothetical protein
LTALAYIQCPKCGHEPLPKDQALPTSCGGCGLVLAKYARGLLKARGVATQAVSGNAAAYCSIDADWSTTLKGVLFYIPPKVDALRFWARAGLLVFFAIWGLRLIAYDFRDGEIAASFLHGPLLVFHEAGHVIFRLFGDFLMVLGGTLGQLLMPAILAGALLLKNRDPYGAAIGLWLLGVSFLDVAPYVYDALHPQLMLLSGTTGEEGGHDWIYLLNATGLLQHARGLGSFTHKLGAIVILLALSWGSFILCKQYHNKVDDVLNEAEL